LRLRRSFKKILIEEMSTQVLQKGESMKFPISKRHTHRSKDVQPSTSENEQQTFMRYAVMGLTIFCVVLVIGMFFYKQKGREGEPPNNLENSNITMDQANFLNARTDAIQTEMNKRLNSLEKRLGLAKSPKGEEKRTQNDEDDISATLAKFKASQKKKKNVKFPKTLIGENEEENEEEKKEEKNEEEENEEEREEENEEENDDQLVGTDE
jgi:hypothetical protein